jgi:hypothetical protein
MLFICLVLRVIFRKLCNFSDRAPKLRLPRRRPKGNDHFEAFEGRRFESSTHAVSMMRQQRLSSNGPILNFNSTPLAERR